MEKKVSSPNGLLSEVNFFNTVSSRRSPQINNVVTEVSFTIQDTFKKDTTAKVEKKRRNIRAVLDQSILNVSVWANKQQRAESKKILTDFTALLQDQIENDTSKIETVDFQKLEKLYMDINFVRYPREMNMLIATALSHPNPKVVEITNNFCNAQFDITTSPIWRIDFWVDVLTTKNIISDFVFEALKAHADELKDNGGRALKPLIKEACNNRHHTPEMDRLYSEVLELF